MGRDRGVYDDADDLDRTLRGGAFVFLTAKRRGRETSAERAAYCCTTIAEHNALDLGVAQIS